MDDLAEAIGGLVVIAILVVGGCVAVKAVRWTAKRTAATADAIFDTAGDLAEGALEKAAEAAEGAALVAKDHLPPADAIRFEGKVVNSQEGTWPLNRLVALYVDGVEVARTTSGIGESPFSGEGIHDGYFLLEVENTYEVGPEHLAGVRAHSRRYSLTTLRNYIGTFIRIEEGSLYEFGIPSKNKELQIRSFAGEYDELPREILGPEGTHIQDRRVFVGGMRAPRSDRLQYDYIRPGGERLIHLRTLSAEPDNCRSGTPMRMELHDRREYVHEFKLGGGVSVATTLIAGVLPGLEASAGFRKGQVETHEFTLPIEVPPRTRVRYELVISEVWDKRVVRPLGYNLELPFEVRKGLSYEPRVVASELCG